MCDKMEVLCVWSYIINMVDSKEYRKIHHWLTNTYGKVSLCENKECPHKSKNFGWAKIRGKEYEYKRENYLMLCRSCHAKYDVTEETLKKARNSRLKTHCIHGHKYAENTWSKEGWHICRKCRSESVMRIYYRKKLLLEMHH